ncbi:carbohydrate ABC transporter permease [Brevibacillus humidisoli]|uniref:carbohydrate ABC transporter permease n=1 Tax=Brevibacillus humidisoli TaxID=2895522 RepID=UPI001E456C0F|nr:carbohydrate ABC transporter permease [Brevibacillus humidisoli]UFJ42633.1 carbohydrate ABC transporter permease [Brevibacillus humidisoli]
MQDSKISQFLSYTLILLLVVVYVLPLLIVFNVSFKSFEEYLLNPMGIVTDIQLSNYVEAWNQGKFSRYFWNSILYTSASTIITVIISLLAAFPVARGYVKWAGFLYLFFIMAQFLPNPLVAQFKLMLSLKEHMPLIGYDSKLGYILLKATGTGVVFMMFVGHIKSISRELDEAASIDGCGYVRYLFQILFPLMKPVIATGVILTAIGTWNDFVGPLLYLTSPENFPITTGLKEFRGQYGNNWPLLACGISIVAAPLIGLYVLIQRYIISGAMAGAVKS